MCKFKDSSTCIKIMLWLVLLIVNTKQAFPMQDPLQEKLGNLKTSLSELKIKLEGLNSKLVTLNLSPYFKQALESKFTMDENTKCIIALADWRWSDISLDSFDDQSILVTRPKPTGSDWKNAEIRFTKTSVKGAQKGPLGKYDKLEINGNFTKSLLDRYISDSPKKYEFDSISLLIGIFIRCNWKNRDDIDDKLKEVSIDARGFKLSRLVLRNLKNLTKLDMLNCQDVKILYIENCPNLNVNKIMRFFVNLENLYLIHYECPQVKSLDLSPCLNLKRLILQKTNLADNMITGVSTSLTIDGKF